MTKYLISDISDQFYNDAEGDGAPMCVVECDGDKVMGAEKTEGGIDGVVDLVNDEVKRNEGVGLKQIVGMFGTAVAYKEVEA